MLAFMKKNRVLWMCTLSLSVLLHTIHPLLSTRDVKYPAMPVAMDKTPEHRDKDNLAQRFLELKIAPNHTKETKPSPWFFQADKGELKISLGVYASSVAEFVRTIVKTGLHAYQRPAYEHLRNQLEHYQTGQPINRENALFKGLKEGLSDVGHE